MLSALDLFSIGIGPSSSHTVGPMRAAVAFLADLANDLHRTAAVTVDLHGSLGATGRGHHSDRAVALGLMGERPEAVNTATVEERIEAVKAAGSILLDGHHRVPFNWERDIRFHREPLPGHPNGMRFRAADAEGALLREAVWYSVGGGFIVREGELEAAEAAAQAAADADATAGHTEAGKDAPAAAARTVPFPFTTGAELLRQCTTNGLRVSELMLRNEAAIHGEATVRERLTAVWAAMQQCVQTGCSRPDSLLPGGLLVRRRAPRLYRELAEYHNHAEHARDWVSLFALAVNEENASGGRVVTAPTNGAAGIIPAVLHYITKFPPAAIQPDPVEFLLAAAAIGILCKTNASISGAEVGCQGEVGSACAMAAAGLAEVLGATPAQVENAAEIGIEHNLGLTCDPIGGLVQIPCIERNAIASNTAITAAHIALRGDGEHRVSLDAALTTMRETGRDMSSKYKETSLGGLAVNVVEC